MFFDSKAPVGIIDSGVGGLTVLVEMNELLPERSIVYFGDTKRMPYGNRSPEEIAQGSNAMISFLEKKGVCAILLACNTISSYKELLTSNVPLISIVEAGAHTVCNLGCPKTVGIIATVATVKSGAYEKLISKVCPNVNVITGSSETLPKIIDSNIDDAALLEEKIRECIDPILDKAPDVKHILLACSHFPIIKNEIEKLYPGIAFLDPAKVQVGMLSSLLGSTPVSNSGRIIELYTTAETFEFAAAIKRLNLEVDSLMKVKLFDGD